jgi:5-formyltetrahydrofolate cyclo-ligase
VASQAELQAVTQRKEELRERVWALLERHGVLRRPARGKIPNFIGAEEAANRLAALPEWGSARVLKSNPDKAQLPVRSRALTEGKLLFMAVPRLAHKLPFFLLDPATLSVPPVEAAVHETAEAIARKVAVSELRPVDLVVCGSVAVNRNGVRLGKGGGYADLELALLVEAGLVGKQTVIATTVHASQVIDEPLPETEHDFRVDLIVTPGEVIACGAPRRPPGVMWEHLSAEKIAAVPVLGSLVARRPRGSAASSPVQARWR